MKIRRLFAAALAALLICAVLSSIAVAEAKTPTQTYLDYSAAVRNAKSLAEVLPYLSKEYRAMLESQPKKDHAVWLGRLKETAPIKDLKITKETINGDKCTLEGAGTSARGNSVKGKVSLVKEGGAWKLDEEGWAT